MKNLTTRARLILLILASALPALGVSVYNGFEHRRALATDAREDLARFAALAARKQEESLEAVRQFLFALSGSAESLMRSPRDCSEFFRKLVAASDGLYNSMGIHGKDGILVCSAVTWTRKVDVNDRRYFRLTADARMFAVGEYQVGRATGLQGVNFGYPVLNETGDLTGVVFAGMDLAKFNELAARTPLPEGGALTVFDHEGTIIARHPATAGNIGEKDRNPAVIEALGTSRKAVFEAEDTSGKAHVYAMEPLGINADGSHPFHVLVSITKDVIFVNADWTLKKNLAGITIAMLLLMVVAWYGSNVVVLRKIQIMLDVARRVHNGDLTARTGFPPNKEELSRLGNALDDMAQALEQREVELQAALKLVQEQAIHDPLTGLYNRRQMEELLSREFLRVQRSGSTFSVVMVDIDHFKRINDTHGHETGDEVLVRIATLLVNAVRRSDIVCRYGGEEFLILLLGSSAENAVRRATEVQRSVRNLVLSLRGGATLSITASFGVAACPEHGTDRDALLRAADRALYRAKNSGRDQVVVANGAAA